MEKHLDRRAALVRLSSLLLTGCGGGSLYSSGPQMPLLPPPFPARPPSPIAPVIWSDLITAAFLEEAASHPPGLSPMEHSRIYAMAFIAGHDALNAVDRRYLPYLYIPATDALADPDLAYATAVYRVMTTLLPGHASFDLGYQQAVANVADPDARQRAVLIGEASARAILDDRANDGADSAQGPYTPGTLPGDYQPMPPIGQATFVGWGQVRPFALTRGDQFRAPPPYRIDDAAYAADFDEVKAKGAANGSTRTATESETATFWLESTPISWQRIATRLSQDWQLTDRWVEARIHAMLQIAQADAYITALDSKYHYNFWRPITAIRGADTDGNAATNADVNWIPYDPVTPPVPEYPSAHALAAMAGAKVLQALEYPYGWDYVVYRSSSRPDVSREYLNNGPESFNAIAVEIGLSRIYVGYHFRRAVEVGWSQGNDVGQWAVDHFLQEVPCPVAPLVSCRPIYP